jgi:hypothetical protein
MKNPSKSNVALIEKEISERSKAIGRSCGSCSLCCKVLFIIDPDLEKPSGVLCRNCTPGKGCGIYANRPRPCRTYSCRWLIDPEFGPEWFPAKANMVLEYDPDDDNPTFWVFVDPAFPTAWRSSPYYEQLLDWSIWATVLIDDGSQTIQLSGDGFE